MAPSGYPSPAKATAMPALSENEHALHSCTNSTTTMLDSGATRHFSGIRSDFQNLKHQYNLKTVHITNGQQVESIRYRSTYLNITSRKAKFDNVWYVLSFGNTRLLSIWELNKSRTSVVFKKGIAIIYNNKTNKVLFKAIRQNGLYLLDSKKNQNSEFYIISRNKPLLNEFNKGLVS